MSSNCRNQQQKETKKKTFRPHGNQISNEWKRKKTLFSLEAIKSAMNGNEKKTFLRQGNQISNEWKRKKKLFCVMTVKSAKNGNGKN